MSSIAVRMLRTEGADTLRFMAQERVETIPAGAIAATPVQSNG